MVHDKATKKKNIDKIIRSQISFIMFVVLIVMKYTAYEDFD